MKKAKQGLVVALSALLASSCLLAGCDQTSDAVSYDIPKDEKNTALSVSGQNASLGSDLAEKAPTLDALTEIGALSAPLKNEQLLKEYYLVGETLAVPENMLIVDGREYAAEASVRFPDGTAVRTGLVSLTQAGRYTVTYIAKVGDTYYSSSVDFYAKKSAIEGTAVKNAETGWLDCSLSNLEVLRYNVPIDISNLTKNDELISLFINASEVGVRDLQEYIIVLTDAYDSSNSIYIRVNAEVNFSINPDDPQYYSRYQSYVGVDFHDRNQFVGAEKSKIHRASIYGTPIHNSFCNMSKTEEIVREDDALSLRWDNEEKAFYVTSPGFYAAPTLVADMDDPSYFSNDWQGFYNGTVYVSLYAKDVVGTANITVKHIGGNEITDGTVDDTTAPALTVDYGEYSENSIPSAVVGSPYKLFEAYAEDLHMSDSEVKCTVYYNYSGSNARMVEIKDGAFTPEYAGTYTLIYSAHDDFNNVSERYVYVNAIRSDSIEFSVQSGTAVAGESVRIPEPSLSVGNASTGNCMLKIVAAKDDTMDVLYEGVLSDCEGVEYRFMSAGVWKIKYIVSDYSRSTEREAEYTVTSGGNIIAEQFSELAIDKYLISGNSYYLPIINIISFAGGESSYPATIKIKYGENKEKVLEGNLFVPDAAEMGERVEIVYYDKNNESVMISGSRELYDIGANGALKLENLFKSENASAVSTDGSVNIIASQDADIELIAKQNAEDFSIKFKLFADVENGSAFDKFDIILTDSLDSSISVKINLQNTLNNQNIAGKLYHSLLYVNDSQKAKIELQQSFAGINTQVYTISYNNSLKKVSIEGNSIDVTSCQNGETFNGFPSNMVYVTFAMRSVKGESVMELYSLNSQIYTNYEDDNISPKVILNGSYENTYEYGAVVDTVTAFGIDAICGYGNATVTVRSVNGGVIKTTDGIDAINLDANKSYSVKLTEYGDYIVQYVTTDRYGNTSSPAIYVFSVADTEKPTLTFNGEMQKYALVNDKLQLPEIVVSDNHSEDLPLYVVAVTPKGVYSKIDPSDYTFTEKGTYTIILTAIDAGGNMTRVSHFVEVIEYEKED